MSTEKNQNQEIKVETNIINFPNQKENADLSKQREEHGLIIQSIASKMDKPNFDQYTLTYVEVLFLSNHGETIEFPKHISSRIISVLATQINKHSCMEDLI